MSLKRKFKAAFLDRDGVINFDKGYINEFSKIKFRNGAIKGLKLLSKNKYLIFIITNQAGVAKGHISYGELIKLNFELNKFFKNKKIKITKIEFCPHHPRGKVKKFKKKCKCRKPGNLMIKRILRRWRIEKRSSFMIGDNLKDKQAAVKSNLYFEYALPNFESQIKNLILR